MTPVVAVTIESMGVTTPCSSTCISAFRAFVHAHYICRGFCTSVHSLILVVILFLQFSATLQQLLVFIKDIYNSFTHNTPTDIFKLYLDFKKAFDSVAHYELFFKLWRCGITGNL